MQSKPEGTLITRWSLRAFPEADLLPFTLATIHAKPDDAVVEIDALAEVVDNIQRHSTAAARVRVPQYW
jgi:hypothetical protein